MSIVAEGKGRVRPAIPLLARRDCTRSIDSTGAWVEKEVKTTNGGHDRAILNKKLTEIAYLVKKGAENEDLNLNLNRFLAEEREYD